jgi:phage terminase large subunit-like protein
MDVFEDEEAKRIYNKPCDILIEEKGSGLSLIQDLHNAGIPNIIKRNPIGDKIGRAHLTSHLVEGNLVYLAKDPQTNQLKRFAKIFTDEILLFPRSKNDDIVDTFTQFLVYAKEIGLLKVPTDPVNESFEWDREEVKFF